MGSSKLSHDGVIFARGYVHCLQCGRQYSGIGTFLQLLPDKECGYRLFRLPDNKQVNNAITASGFLKNPPVLIITGVYLFFGISTQGEYIITQRTLIY
ncbi:hypothetical protein B9086_007910 [Morganella morganii subsp. morganii]|nr:hypothetical protein AL531_13135 [Morganella morganii]RNW12699.1 hypothetical protein B9086_007910 [Morganella morganii subsp. morganii]AZP24475.1 hypothetical protein D8758_02790 [Morganella morganii]PCO29645.1 hypothetical protein CP987_03130 [Morganella morganii]PCP74092.1 hypothetical protein CQA25_05345 [Morganella morganii]